MPTTISGSDAFADADKVIADQQEKAQNNLNTMSIAKAESLGTRKVNEILQLGNLTKTDTNTGKVTEEAKPIKNTLTATSDLVRTYGIRQEIITKNSNEDSNVVARRKLNDNCKPKEEIIVECLGDTMYKVGYGVHIILPFLPTYSDCFMYIKEVNNEWRDNGTFISSLTLTPSRVMDTQEWTDDDEEQNTSSSTNGTTDSELAGKILALLRQQIGKPYVSAAAGPDSFDCSGLVYYCFNQFKDQLINGKAVSRTTEEMAKDGTEVSKDDTSKWQPCDLLLYKGDGTYPPPGHVVVYTGNNKVIEAPSSGKTVYEHENTRPASALYCVRRVLPEVTKSSSEGVSNGKYSDNLVKFTESWEGYKDHVYNDGGGTMTIGYGTTAGAGDFGKKAIAQGTCTESEAVGWLKQEMDEISEQIVKATQSKGVSLSQFMFDCLCDISYQWGYPTIINNDKHSIFSSLCKGDVQAAKDGIKTLGYARRDNARCDVLNGNYTLNN